MGLRNEGGTPQPAFLQALLVAANLRITALISMTRMLPHCCACLSRLKAGVRSSGALLRASSSSVWGVPQNFPCLSLSLALCRHVSYRPPWFFFFFLLGDHELVEGRASIFFIFLDFSAASAVPGMRVGCFLDSVE